MRWPAREIPPPGHKWCIDAFRFGCCRFIGMFCNVTSPPITHWRPLCPPLCTLSITSCKPAGAIQTDIIHGQKSWSLNVSCAKPVAARGVQEPPEGLKGGTSNNNRESQDFFFFMIIIINDVLMAHMDKYKSSHMIFFNCTDSLTARPGPLMDGTRNFVTQCAKAICRYY